MTKTKILRQSLTPIPKEAHGVLYVATNKPISVGVEGTQDVTEEDVGGYYLIHKNDLQVMLQALKNVK